MSTQADPLKIVNILLPATTINDSKDSDANAEGTTEQQSSSTASTAAPILGYVPARTVVSDDVLFAEPSFSEKFFRYLVIVIYLGGLSSLGFFLSIYYIFFWDSSMPPIYKPPKKPPVFTKP